MRLQKDKEKEVAIVTGSSSGIGQEIALTLARNGFLTYATMRNPMKGEYLKSFADKEKLSLKIAQLDVTKETSASCSLLLQRFDTCISYVCCCLCPDHQLVR